MNVSLSCRSLLRVIAFLLLSAGSGLIAKPVAHEIVGGLSAVQAKAIWKKWKTVHRRHSSTSIKPGQPVFWLRVGSCKISTLTLQESNEEALHRFPAVRRLGGGGLVVFAHRDLHFRRLGNICTGDKIELEYADNRSAKYSVQSIRILPPEEATAVIETGAGDGVLYLLTCYPFHFIGAAPKRFVVQATRCPD